MSAKEERILKNNYYKVGGYWKGWEAITKLSEKTMIDEKIVEKWLRKQAMWQIYLPSPRKVPRPHWTIDKVDEIHQADLLFLPHDKVGKKTFKYALVVIDIASRFKDAEALSSKSSNEVEKAFEKIYSRRLRWPKTMIVDPGTEFMGSVTKLMEKHDVVIQRSEAGNHRAQTFVENAHKIIGEKIFSHQYAEEMLTKDRSRKWVKSIVRSMNSSVIRLTGMEPVKAYAAKTIETKEKKYPRVVGFEEKKIDLMSRLRYLLAPGEEEGGGRRRATDPIWSQKVFL